MSLDELTEEIAPPQRPSTARWVLFGAAMLAAVLSACIGVWAVMNNNAQQAARAHHDALLESVDVMGPMWEQLDLPVDQRLQAAIESGARLGRPGSAIEVTPQLRLSEPNRIGVVTTVRSDGITTLLVAIVRKDLGGSTSAIGSGCEVSSTIEGMSCEDWVNEQLSTFTAPGG